MAAATNESMPSKEDESARYASAIKRLQTLQDQVTILRPGIATIAEALVPPLDSTMSTTQIYVNFARTATQALRNVKQLKAEWEGSSAQEALGLSRDSLAQNEDLDWEFISKGRWHALEGLDQNVAELSVNAP